MTDDQRLLRAHLRKLQAKALRFTLAGLEVPEALASELADYGWLVSAND
jgi:hypothetical protein